MKEKRSKRDMWTNPQSSKTIYLKGDCSSTGIEITFDKSRSRLYVASSHDNIHNIMGEVIPLYNFFIRLGITKADINNAFLDKE